MFDRRQTVASVVLDHSECAEVFRRHRIDYCCRGDLSVEAAAHARGVTVEALMEDLRQAVAERRGGPGMDPRELSTPGLVAHIISRYHEPLRRALPPLRALAEKVSRVHRDHNPKLLTLATALDQLATTLLQHIEEEETSVFPALTGTHDAALAGQQLASMREEHAQVAELLERIRAASDAFALPEWACTSYRTLLSELRDLERDVFTHVHIENHVLAPRFATAPA
jgi:regulator of cell morphogenesis and NO signaling